MAAPRERVPRRRGQPILDREGARAWSAPNFSMKALRPQLVMRGDWTAACGDIPKLTMFANICTFVCRMP